MPVDNPLREVSLEDKYRLTHGKIYLTGVQALVKLPMLQRALDKEGGLHTAGFISGYRGSPLGTYDQQLWKASRFLQDHDIHFVPGVNEELAATAAWGTQQLAFDPNATVDGVFALWYGKSPGVDRSMDALRHGNAAGASTHGGVLVLVGDDHLGRSASVPNQSELDLIAAAIPVLNPASIEDYLRLGLHGIALSRYSGCWAGMVVLAEIADGAASIDIDLPAMRPVIPVDVDGDAPRHIRWPDPHTVAEARLHEKKLPAVLKYARENHLNQVILGGENASFGIITTGKAYQDVREALLDLGLTEERAIELGIRLMKVDLIWPLEPTSVRAFCSGLKEILVVEEKRATIEPQLKELLFNDDVRPRVVGKTSGASIWEASAEGTLLQAKGELSPQIIAVVIAERLLGLNLAEPEQDALRKKLDAIRAAQREANRPRLQALLSNASAVLTQGGRAPSFCSGCPHNTSTKVPEGSRAMSGIGCHFMAQWVYPESTAPFTQMGSEGAAWVGQSLFTTTRHMFVNLGDGTFYHSGLLAIRQAIAAKVNVTYKILYNDAVAMTGGQPVDGVLTVPAMASVLLAEGCRRVVVVSDEAGKYSDALSLPERVDAFDRSRLDEIQTELREMAGCTAIIYDQTCAAEKRRRRKNNAYPDPARRVVINPAVCEGCGDCNKTSNCLSIVPLETALGRKRAIDQSSCNKDFRCLDGFCPSFVTVEGGALRKQIGKHAEDGRVAPDIQPPEIGADSYGILISGVGGSGVVTIGALLGMAAHLEGKAVSVLDMTGLAQKGGAVFSHVRIARHAEQRQVGRIHAADLLLGCDLGSVLEPETLTALRKGRTQAVVSTAEAPTGNFARDPDLPPSSPAAKRELEHRVGEDRVHAVDADKAALALLGDTIQANALLLGYAWQRRFVPLSRQALRRAIELNGVAVSATLTAFEWGRLLAVEPSSVLALMPPPTASEPATLDAVVEHRSKLLVDYQDERLAQRYRALVSRVRAIETKRLGREADSLAMAVARHYYKVLAIKDEYEVARLHASPDFKDAVERMFEGDFKIRYHLAPPGIAARDRRTGHLKKREYGSWMIHAFRLLSKARRWRNTILDPFARSNERREELALIERYEGYVEHVVAQLHDSNADACVQLLELPERIRGYGHVRMKSMTRAYEEGDRLVKHIGDLTVREPAQSVT